MAKKAGQLSRHQTGQFAQGVSGNPAGRPKGSKNKITLFKMATEEAWRTRNQDKIDMVLDLILANALDGDKGACKMIFDGCISKANVQEDKAAGHKQQITVHKMTVTKDATSPIEEPEDE